MKKESFGTPKKSSENSILNSISLNASRDRMSELFSDFKKLNVDQSSSSSPPSKSHAVIDQVKKVGGLFNPATSISTTASAPESPISAANVSSNTDSSDLGVKNYTEQKSHPFTTALYVGDLDINVTETTLYELFSGYKSLLSVKLCCSPTTKRSLGYGYVNFSDAKDAKIAIEDLNYTSVSNKEIRIMPYMKGKTKSFMSTNVFISNLNTQGLSLRGFYEKFKGFGEIISCKLDIEKRQGFISFKDKTTAENFVDSHNSLVIDGSKIHCSVHIPKLVRDFSNDFKPYKKNDDTRERSSISPYTKTPISTKTSPENPLITKVHREIENKAQNPSSESKKSDNFTQIYVKGLPVTVTDDEVTKLFSYYGVITDLYKEAVVNYKSSWCLITFENHESAKRAIEECHKSTYKGKKLICTKALKKSERFANQSPVESITSLEANPVEQTPFDTTHSNTSTSRLYIYNLPQTVNENFFKLFLSSYKLNGKVIKFSFPKGSHESYIEFEKRSDANEIHQKLNKVNLSGLILQTSLTSLASDASNTKKAPHVLKRQVTEGTEKSSKTNFHPIDHRHHDHHLHFANPVSSTVTNYVIPSLSSYNSTHSNLISAPSASTNVTNFSSSTDSIIQNINGKQYKLIPISNPPSVNENSLDAHSAYLMSRQASLPLSYSDLYSSGIDAESNEKLYSELERLSLRLIDFLKYPSATRPRNLQKVLNYLVVTFWNNKLEDVEKSLVTIEKDPEFSEIYKSRLLGAIKLFGLDR